MPYSSIERLADMLWSVVYGPATMLTDNVMLEQGYQGHSRVLAWFDVQRLRANGNDVEVWVRPAGSLKLHRYAMYPAFTWTL